MTLKATTDVNEIKAAVDAHKRVLWFSPGMNPVEVDLVQPFSDVRIGTPPRILLMPKGQPHFYLFIPSTDICEIQTDD